MKSLDKWKKHRIALLSRLLGLYLFLGVWSLTLVGRLVYLQIFKSEEYRLKAEQQQIGYIELSPKRGISWIVISTNWPLVSRSILFLSIPEKYSNLSTQPELSLPFSRSMNRNFTKYSSVIGPLSIWPEKSHPVRANRSES